jgi:hypothetical protein
MTRVRKIKKNTTKIKEMKLGRFKVEGHNVYGFALMGKNEIYIDSRLKGRKHMDTLIHEKLHLLFPEWSETRVIQTSRALTAVLWSQSYRRNDD